MNTPKPFYSRLRTGFFTTVLARIWIGFKVAATRSSVIYIPNVEHGGRICDMLTWTTVSIGDVRRMKVRLEEELKKFDGLPDNLPATPQSISNEQELMRQIQQILEDKGGSK